MRIFVQTVAVAILLSGASAAIAAEKEKTDPKEKAKAFYLQGKEKFSAGLYQEALDAFTEAYNLSSETVLLYNLAVCSEKTGDTERAIAYYELYLEEKPDAPDAAKTKEHVESLKNGPPDSETQQQPAVQPKTEPKPKDGSAAAKNRKLRVYSDDQAGKERKIFWPGVAIGAGGLLIAGGVITAIMAKQEYDGLESGCAPECADGKIGKVRGMAVAADVQLAVGVAAAGAGAFFWIYGKRTGTEEETAWRAVPIGPMCKPGLFVEGEF